MIEHVLRRQSRELAKFRAEQRSVENPATPLTAENLAKIFDGPETHAGVRINASNALSISGVWSAMRRISETVAALPLGVFERLERGKRKATEHPLYRVLHERFNPEMTSMQGREMLQSHVLFWGTAYAEIEMNQAGQILGLWPLLPDRTAVHRRNGVRFYTTQLPDGQTVPLAASRVFQLTGLGFDGLTGYSLIDKARENLGLTKATEEFGSRFFGHGATTSGVLEHPGQLGDMAAKHLRESFEKHQGGLSNSHRVLIAEEGMKWVANTVPPNNAQFLETRKFQIGDVARWFNIPLHMLAQMEGGASYASVEQMSLEFVQYCINPWLVRWEQAMNNDLLGERERKTLFTKHEVKGLMRGDHSARQAFYTAMRNIGVYSANDIRELEDENPVEGGDIYFIQGAMIPVDIAAQAKPNNTAPAPDAAPVDADTPKAKAARERALLDVASRMLKRELPQLRKLLKQGEEGWSQGVDAIYREQTAAYAKALAPLVDVILAFGSEESRALVAATDAIAADLAAKEYQRARMQLDSAGFAGAETLLDAWESSRAQVAAQFANEQLEAIAYPNPLHRVAP